MFQWPIPDLFLTETSLKETDIHCIRAQRPPFHDFSLRFYDVRQNFSVAKLGRTENQLSSKINWFTVGPLYIYEIPETGLKF